MLKEQKTFSFLPEIEREKHIAQFEWTKIAPGQEVNTIHTEVWFTDKEKSLFGFGENEDEDEDEQVRNEKKVEKHWHVYLLPVLVSDYGNEFRLPGTFEVINGVNKPVQFKHG